MVAGKQAPAVDGNLSPEQALRQLLQGSGLDYQIDAGSVTLHPLSSGTGAAGSPLELGTTDIKVVGERLPSTAGACLPATMSVLKNTCREVCWPNWLSAVPKGWAWIWMASAAYAALGLGEDVGGAAGQENCCG